ncbi:MAG: hypothetical protein CL820_17920 [Croceicoccus sp.]|nr:hypothetical protein [Croceicoccus sp.]
MLRRFGLIGHNIIDRCQHRRGGGGVSLHAIREDLDALKYYATFCVETGASLLSLHQQISLDLQICI